MCCCIWVEDGWWLDGDIIIIIIILAFSVLEWFFRSFIHSFNSILWQSDKILIHSLLLLPYLKNRKILSWKKRKEKKTWIFFRLSSCVHSILFVCVWMEMNWLIFDFSFFSQKYSTLTNERRLHFLTSQRFSFSLSFSL